MSPRRAEIEMTTQFLAGGIQGFFGLQFVLPEYYEEYVCQLGFGRQNYERDQRTSVQVTDVKAIDVVWDLIKEDLLSRCYMIMSFSIFDIGYLASALLNQRRRLIFHKPRFKRMPAVITNQLCLGDDVWLEITIRLVKEMHNRTGLKAVDPCTGADLNMSIDDIVQRIRDHHSQTGRAFDIGDGLWVDVPNGLLRSDPEIAY